MKRSRSIKKVKFETITFGENVRLPNLENIEVMADSIEMKGIEVMPSVWERPNGTYDCLQGFRRLKGAGVVLERNPDKFYELFPNGEIECIVYTDLTEKEAIDIKVDQGVQQTLKDPMELQNAANMLFRIGATPTEIKISLAGLLDEIYPMSATNQKKLKDMKDAQHEALEKELEVEAEIKRREIDDFIKWNRNGVVQNLHTVYRCPHVVYAARYYEACGKVLPCLQGADYIPTVTLKEAAKLWKCAKADFEEVVDGVQRWTQAIPGPKFKEAWEELIRTQKDRAANPKDKRPKAMSSTAMKEEAQTFSSKGLGQLTRKHAGEEIENFAAKDIDEMLMVAELVAEYQPDLWAKCVEFAEAKKQELAAAVGSEDPEGETEDEVTETETVS